MDAEDERALRIRQQRTSNGHNIYCLMSVQSLGAIETWPYEHNFTSDCHVFPTRWILGITYEQFQTTGRFSCSVILRRDDSLDILAHAHVLISFVNINGQVLRFERTIFNEPMLSGEARQGSVTDVTMPGFLRYLNNQDIDLQITIFIRSCHSTRNFRPLSQLRLRRDLNTKSSRNI